MDVIMAAQRGATIKGVTRDDIKQLPIPLPALSEQRRIVEILDQADAVRKKRVEANAKAASILPAFFYKMFGDPATNSKGWNTGELGDVILETQYGTSTKANSNGDGIPVLRMNNIDSDGHLDLADLKYVVLSKKKQEKYALIEGDILFNRTNSKELVGKTGLWRGDIKAVPASYLIRVRVDREQALPEFIWAYMNCPFIKQMLLNKSRRAIGMANINAKELRSLPLILPAKEHQEAFSKKLNSVEQLRTQRKKNGEAINRLFVTLLHRAFTGDLTVKWRKAHMKEILAEMEEQAKALEAPLVMKGSAKAKSKQQPDKNMQIKRRKKSGIEYRRITNHLLSFRPAYLKIQKDMERLSRALKPSYLNIYEQMSQALAPIREHHLEITRSFELSGLTSSRLAEIALANERWQNLIDQATAMNHHFEGLKRTHQTWIDAFKPMQDNLAQLQAAAKLSLCEVAHRLSFTEHLFAGIDFESLKRIAIPEPVVPDLERVILNLTSTYKNLADSIRTIPEVTRLPTYVLPGATREIFTTGYALDAICISEETDTEENPVKIQLVSEVEQETSGCITLLQSVDPALVRPYIGAHDALHSSNADRARHILTSLREFWNHMLRKLAPDEMIMSWLPGDRKDLLHKGRPTRRARVLYVCRKFNHDPLTDLVVQDTRALVKLVEFFNRVHELDSELTDDQLKALLLRTDSWLMYILQIWEGTK